MKKTAEQRGLAQQALSYTAYGHLPGMLDAVLGFNGELRDGVMQAYPLGNGHRFYPPALMRFLSPDTLSPFGRGGVNAYCYCEGDPINNMDPSGQMKKASGPMRLYKGPRQPVNSLERLPNEIIGKIVDFLPVESVHQFAQVSSRMRDIVMDVPQPQRMAFDRIVFERPLSRLQMAELSVIASGRSDLPTRVLVGSGIKENEIKQALLNPDRAEAEASLIRIDDARRERLGRLMRGPIPFTFGMLRIE